jgi:RNA polymerase sigma-70 factor (ECF subfamily)
MERPSVMIRIDNALHDLEHQDPHKARLIEMRFFGGLTAEESAEVLQLPVNTIRRELRVAQAWLHRELDRNLASD